MVDEGIEYHFEEVMIHDNIYLKNKFDNWVSSKVSMMANLFTNHLSLENDPSASIAYEFDILSHSRFCS